jgi:hypothetical protein
MSYMRDNPFCHVLVEVEENKSVADILFVVYSCVSCNKANGEHPL